MIKMPFFNLLRRHRQETVDVLHIKHETELAAERAATSARQLNDLFEENGISLRIYSATHGGKR